MARVKTLKFMQPTVFRFMEETHITQYLGLGELRLTHIAKFGKQEDMERADAGEGKLSQTFFSSRFPPVVLTSDPHELDYVLCASLSPYAYNTKGCNSCLRIFDVEGLAKSVADSLENLGCDVRGVYIGPCTYAGRNDVCAVPEHPENIKEHLHNLMKIGSGYAPFQKPWRFLVEEEFRIVWSLCRGSRVPGSYITVKVDHPEWYAQKFVLPNRFLRIITWLQRLLVWFLEKAEC